MVEECKPVTLILGEQCGKCFGHGVHFQISISHFGDVVGNIYIYYEEYNQVSNTLYILLLTDNANFKFNVIRLVTSGLTPGKEYEKHIYVPSECGDCSV